MEPRFQDQVFNEGTPPTHRVTHLEGIPLEGPVSVAIRARSETMLVLEVRMPAGSRSNPHRHTADSTGYLITGRVRAVVDGTETLLGPGDAFVHPRNVEHSVEALQDSHWIEIKSPPVQPF
jgi:quercetin dioxygenase-like cupin family protein